MVSGSTPLYCTQHSSFTRLLTDGNETSEGKGSPERGAIVLVLYCLPLSTFYKWRRVRSTTFYLLFLLSLCCCLWYCCTNFYLLPFSSRLKKSLCLALGTLVSPFYFSFVPIFLLPLSPLYLPSVLNHPGHIQCRPQGPVVRNLLSKFTRPLPRAQ